MKRQYSTKRRILIFERILFKLAREEKKIFNNQRKIPTFIPSIDLEYKLNNLFNSVTSTTVNVLDNKIINNDLDIFQSMLSKIQQTKTDQERLALIKLIINSEEYIAPILLNQLILKIKDINIIYALLFVIKKSGLVKYVLSCTTSVYNSLLRASFTIENDPHKIKFILNEMLNNGVKADPESKLIINNIIDNISINKKERNDISVLFNKIE